jgi:hypothetical protein
VNKIQIITTFVAVTVVGVGLYVFFHGSASMPASPETLRVEKATPSLAAPFPRQEKDSSTPPPPPRPAGEPQPKPSPEPQRAFIGTTTQEVRHIEQYLPVDSRIATYAVSETEQKAALVTTDLGDKVRKVVVVYNTQSSQKEPEARPLFLGILVPEGDNMILRSSTRLYGGSIYASLFDQRAVPFAIRDVTGDGRPEIIVSSGVGASLGGALQIFSFDGSSLRKIGNADGHVLDLITKGPGQPSEITAQSRYETKPKIYRWNGQQFEP